MDEPPIKLNWKADGFYDGLDGSLDDWLKENHRGRAPSELTREIERLVGHAVGPHAVRIRSNRLGMYTLPGESARAISTGKRVAPDEPVPEFDPDAVWEATKRLASELRKKATKASRLTVDFREEIKPIAVVYMADLHLGNSGTDYDAIQRDTELIAATDGMYSVCGGDNLDNFLDAFFLGAMASQVITASTQWSLFERYLSIIKDKILYAHIGNHERWTHKRSQIDKFDELVSGFGVLNVQDIGVATILVGTQEYIVQAVHKFWARSRLNVLWPAMRLLDHGIAVDADVNIVEHEHTPAAGWFNRRGKRRIFIRTGSYKTLDGYALEHGFYGSEVAPAIVVFFPEEHQVQVLHDVQIAASYITYLRQE